MDNVLVTERGMFQVTQECLFTPMVSLYLAAVCSVPMPGTRRTGWLLLALPLFFVLGVVRLLVLALPPQIVQSPVLLAHGFYQFLAAGVSIIGAAHLALREGPGVRASQRTLVAMGLALAAGAVAGRIWEPVLLRAAAVMQMLVPSTMTSLVAAVDVQGALALLPAFQVGLVAGLWYSMTGGRRRRQLAVALAVLACLQILILAALGTMTARLGAEPHTLVIRALALGVPLAIAVVWVPTIGTSVGDRSYARFWNDVGASFPSLTDAASTRYYFENEKRLLSEAVPSLSGCTLLKTDLWDEAKNTRIMQWAADQGAQVYGIDLRTDRPPAETTRPRRSVRRRDVRRLPFAPARSTPSTRWARSSISRKRKPASTSSPDCSSRAAGSCLACRTATIRSCDRSSSRSSIASGSTRTGTRRATRAGRCVA
jgi:Ca2+/Na+ antiporter